MYDSEDESESAVIHSANDVDIFSFIDAGKIPITQLEKPYVLTPVPGGEESYAALRDALDRDGQVGIVCVMFRSRRQLAILSPHGAALALRTLRWIDAGTAMREAPCLWPQYDDADQPLTMDATGSWGDTHYYGRTHLGLAPAQIAMEMSDTEDESASEGIELAAPAAPPGCPARHARDSHARRIRHRQSKRPERARSAARGRKLHA